MLKPRLKLTRNKEGRGTEASAFLFARPSLFVRRLGRASRGYVLAGAGVVAAAVAGGKAGSPGGDIGLGPTQLLVDGTLEPDLA
jgi:hypothetical protein